MKNMHSLRLQGYIDDLPLDCACEYTNLQLKKFLHTNIAYQQTLAIRLLNKRIGYQKDYQKQLKEMHLLLDLLKIKHQKCAYKQLKEMD